MDPKQQYLEKKLATRIVELADQCRGDVHSRLKKLGVALPEIPRAEINVLIGHAIREAMLTGRQFERWQVARQTAADAGNVPAIPPLPKVILAPDATTRVNPAYDDDKTTEKMPLRR